MKEVITQFMVTIVSNSRRYRCSTYMQGMKLEEDIMYVLLSVSLLVYAL